MPPNAFFPRIRDLLVSQKATQRPPFPPHPPSPFPGNICNCNSGGICTALQFVKQRLLRNRAGSDAATSHDFLRKRLQRTHANQLHWLAQQSALFCVQSVRHSRVVCRVGWTVARPSGPPPQTAAPGHPPAPRPPRAASRTSPRPANTIHLKQLLQCHPLQTHFRNAHFKQLLQLHTLNSCATSSTLNSCCKTIHFTQLLQPRPLQTVVQHHPFQTVVATSSTSNSCCNIILVKQLLQQHPFKQSLQHHPLHATKTDLTVMMMWGLTLTAPMSQYCTHQAFHRCHIYVTKSGDCFVRTGYGKERSTTT